MFHGIEYRRPLTANQPTSVTIGGNNYLQPKDYTMSDENKDDKLTRIEMPKKPLYSTTEIAEALGLTVSTIRMAKMNGQIEPDSSMSTTRYTWYTAEAVEDFAKSRGFYIVFTIAS